MHDINFTIPEILSLIGLTQCVYLVVHLLMRSATRQSTSLAILYFTILAYGFFLDFAQRFYSDVFSAYWHLKWWAWFLGPCLSALLIIKFCDYMKPLRTRNFLILLIVPACWLISLVTFDQDTYCEQSLWLCDAVNDLLILAGLIAGTLALLIVFLKQGLLSSLQTGKFGAERYWLSICLIVMNIGFLFVMLLYASRTIDDTEMVLMRNIIGLGFVYLVSTNLLRLYPLERKSLSKSQNIEDLSDENLKILNKIQHLMDVEKVYQEEGYSRKDLARECNASEVTISKIINSHYQKSFPQLLNERRVEDAKTLLKQTKASIGTIAFEVGFNALPTFNRVFKDITGFSPSEFRKMP